MSENPTQYKLPIPLANWPWQRRLNPHYLEVKAESDAWVQSFHPFEPKEQKKFDLCNLSLLACLTYQMDNRDLARLGCDLMNFYFVYDEYTDVMDKAGAQHIADIVMDAFRNPTTPRPEGESFLGEMARQLLESAQKIVAPDAPCLKHFISGFDAYTAAVVVEADDRFNGHVRSVKEYLSLRKDTAACKPTLSVIEFGLDLPDEYLQHPVVAALMDSASELIGVTNDLNSYVLEEARGLDGHNIVTSVMRELKLDRAGALEWLQTYINNFVSTFLSDLERLPSWGEEIDKKVKTYIDGLGHWVRGNDDWSFESERYYGTRGLDVQKHRIVSLLPRQPLGFATAAKLVLFAQFLRKREAHTSES